MQGKATEKITPQREPMMGCFHRECKCSRKKLREEKNFSQDPKKNKNGGKK